jgi:hypothetical protein
MSPFSRRQRLAASASTVIAAPAIRAQKTSTTDRITMATKALDRVIAMCKDKVLVDRAKSYKEGR